MTEGKWVAYYRVSTDRQGKSGLGLEAQRAAVVDFLNGGRWKVARNLLRSKAGSDPTGQCWQQQSRPAVFQARPERASLTVAQYDSKPVRPPDCE